MSETAIHEGWIYGHKTYGASELRIVEYVNVKSDTVRVLWISGRHEGKRTLSNRQHFLSNAVAIMPCVPLPGIPLPSLRWL